MADIDNSTEALEDTLKVMDTVFKFLDKDMEALRNVTSEVSDAWQDPNYEEASALLRASRDEIIKLMSDVVEVTTDLNDLLDDLEGYENS